MQDSPGNRIFLIPSYGTDHTLYDNITFSKDLESRIVKIDWLPLHSNETLEEYAKKFIEAYNIKDNDTIIGTSMGGIVGIEINKNISLDKLILISSIKTWEEHPLFFKFLRATKLYKIITGHFLKSVLIAIAPLYGKKISQFGWFNKVFRQTPNQFLENGLKAILYWKNHEIKGNTIHIHGTKDPLFPFSRIKNVNFPIQKGTHAMIRLKANEIAGILNKVLNTPG